MDPVPETWTAVGPEVTPTHDPLGTGEWAHPTMGLVCESAVRRVVNMRAVVQTLAPIRGKWVINSALLPLRAIIDAK